MQSWRKSVGSTEVLWGKRSGFRRSLRRLAWVASSFVLLGFMITGTCFGQSTYGSGVNSDSLNNITVGPSGHQVSYRFLANQTGTISKVHFYLIVDGSHAGYNAGTGGTLLIRLETDDGTTAHNPSGKVLGSYKIEHPSNPFPVISLSPAPKVESGQLYHLVFSNVDGNPTENYVSVDDLYMSHPLDPMQPKVSNEDCATLIDWSSGSWGVYDYNTPIFEFDFSDGSSMGQGYMEVWVGAPESIGGTRAVREEFTVSGENRVVSKFSVRVARTSGSAPLTIRLEYGNGQLIEQGTIPSADVAESSSSNPQYHWVTYTFAALRTLFKGDTYHIDLEASSGTSYQVFPVRKGSAQLFANTTYFPDGYAQFKNGASWVGWTQWGVTNRTDGDLQFYFTMVP